jgi:hypothetical protein
MCVFGVGLLAVGVGISSYWDGFFCTRSHDCVGLSAPLVLPVGQAGNTGF